MEKVEKILEELRPQPANGTISSPQISSEEIKTFVNKEIGRFVNKIPARFRYKDFKNFNFQVSRDKNVSTMIENIRQSVVKNLQSITLLGSCGSGKTHVAIALMKDWLSENMTVFNEDEEVIHPETNEFYKPNNKKCRQCLTSHLPQTIFLSTAELLFELKSSFSDKEISVKDILNKYSQIQLLVLDDFAAERASEYSREVLYMLIDRRYRDKLQTIITSNLSPADISEKIDDRIISRLSEMGQIIDFDMPDYRLNVNKTL